MLLLLLSPVDNSTIVVLSFQYDAIIEEDEEPRPDIEIATQELPEGSQFIENGDEFENREFPDAYSTPPPQERLPDHDGECGNVR